ncbi:MAG: pyridoxal-phosphate dependent enzyme [Acidobacteria bacterium]|nr:pyridoxal-phosphate dependent enzyme [Acidobacteriota bacterium]
MISILRQAFEKFGTNPHSLPLMVDLPKLSEQTGNNVTAFLGSRLPSGSLKFISVVGMLANLVQQKSGRIEHIFASTSGNTGIAAALLLHGSGVKFHPVIDPRTAPGKKKELLDLGADIVEVSSPDPLSGYLGARLKAVAALVRSTPHSVDLDQYSNVGALAGHYYFTGPYIWNYTAGQVDIMVSPIGTGGTFGGTAFSLRGLNDGLAAVPVDCEGSAILGNNPGKHLLTGLGAHIRCNNVIRAYPAMCGCKPQIIGDEEAFKAAHWLRAEEGIWAGGSSGAAIAAVRRVASQVSGKRIVVLLPDGGESYEETVFDPAWLAKHNINLN